jgi:hypothetical protein
MINKIFQKPNGVVSRMNPNMIHQIFMEGVMGCVDSNIMHGEIPERMLVQGLEQPVHPENPILDNRQYHHVPCQRSCYA